MTEAEDSKPSDPDLQPSRSHGGGGVRWRDVDIEAGGSGRPLRRNRSRSRGSLSIHSVHSNVGSVDPSAVLPITYRTMWVSHNQLFHSKFQADIDSSLLCSSIDIEDYNRKNELAERAQKGAVTGKLHPCLAQ